MKSVKDGFRLTYLPHISPYLPISPLYLPQVKSVKDGFRKYKLGQVMTGKRLELQARLRLLPLG